MLLLTALLAAGACGGSETSTPAPSPSPSNPTITETFSGTLALSGSRFYSFSFTVDGTITATLEEIGGPGVDPAVVVDLGIGTPAGVTCSAGRTAVQVGGGEGTVQRVSATQPAGTYCVIVADRGNLSAPAQFRIVIEHP